MTYTTLKTTVAALALTAGTAFAADDAVEDTTPLNPDSSISAEAGADVDTDDVDTDIETDLSESADAAGNTFEDAGDATAEAMDDAADEVDNATDMAEDSLSDDTETGATAEVDSAAEVDTEVTRTDSTMAESFSGMIASDLIGLEVMSADDEKIGEIQQVVRQGDKLAAIVGVGGFLGLGERDVAVPLEEISRAGEGDLKLSTWTKAELEAQPEADLNTLEALEPEATLEEAS
ncbi:PRC-barrel domain-containing protein [Sulfitobacter aestuarii]|uniref:PRC-barrel domain-containing protein n=1 Tax=Sulfitobacter aestuarii TaxID=2161676 RepID=A0ABW5U7U6_9RHOB